MELNPEELEDKIVLNVGAGKSNLGPDLKNRGVTPKLLINLDLIYKNIGLWMNREICTVYRAKDPIKMNIMVIWIFCRTKDVGAIECGGMVSCWYTFIRRARAVS